jgi:hypothetical protein
MMMALCLSYFPAHGFLCGCSIRAWAASRGEQKNALKIIKKALKMGDIAGLTGYDTAVLEGYERASPQTELSAGEIKPHGE